jgi:GT2 family glycosyltransferase
VRLDVVIVAYRSAEHLPACLAPLPDDAHVVVVDNASGDDSPDLAEAAGVEVVRNPTNRGFAVAANQGAAAGSAEAVLFLNPDAVVQRDDLSRLLAALEADPTLAAVGPRLVSPAGHEQRAWWPFPSPLGTWIEALGLHRLRRPVGSEAQGFVVGACLLVRRHAYEAVGGFDERFWLYGEEADLCRRLWDKGWKVRLVPEAVATHVGGASGTTVSGVAFEHFQRGAELFTAKHHGGWGLASHRVGLLVGSLLRLPFLVVMRRRSAGRRAAMVSRLVRRLATHPFEVTPASGRAPRPRTHQGPAL